MKTNPFHRALLFGLAFLVLLNSAGVFVFTYVETGFHRLAEYAERSDKDAQTLSLSSAEFSSLAWVGERDFVYNGNVYDYDKIAAVNGKISIRCHSDQEETNLKNSLSTNFETGTKNIPGAKPVKDLLKVFPVFPSALNTHHFNSFDDSNIVYIPTGNQHPRSAELSLSTPPPEIA